MTPLQAKKQLLVTEATLQRELLRADFGRLAGHAGGIKRKVLSVSSIVRSALSIAQFLGLFGRSSGGTSKLGRIVGLARTARTLWSLWSSVPGPKRTSAVATPATSRDLATAIDELRRASGAKH